MHPARNLKTSKIREDSYVEPLTIVMTAQDNILIDEDDRGHIRDRPSFSGFCQCSRQSNKGAVCGHFRASVRVLDSMLLGEAF